MSVEPLEGRALLTVAPVAVSPRTPAGRPASLATLTPTLTWSPVAGVNGYQARVLDWTAGSHAVAATVSASAAARYTLPARRLAAGHRYVWNVRLVDGTVTGRVGASPFRYFVAPPVAG